MLEEDLEKKLEELKRDRKISNNFLKYNDKNMYINDNYDFLKTGLIQDEIYYLMMDLGIPIGIVNKTNKNKLIDNSSKYLYTPINSYTDLKELTNNNDNNIFIVNPNYMNENQVRNIALLLEFISNKNIFSLKERVSLQDELIDNVPLEYEKAMKVFDKYYTKDICELIMEEENIEEKRFYEITGLDKSREISINDDLMKLQEIEYQHNKAKNNEEKEKLDNELENILNDLKKKAINKFKSESDIKKFLDNIIKFNNYSFNNQMLIYLQKPNAQYVSSFKTYRDLGYTINKGATGIKIFIPNFYNLVKIKVDNENYEIKPYFTLNKAEIEKYKNKDDDSITFYNQKLSGFKIGYVFDASDTNMPLEVINNDLNPILEDKTANDIMDTFIKTIYKSGYKVSFSNLEGTTKGYCDHTNKEIVVKKGLGSLVQMKVLIHEYGHALAHSHLENNHLEYEKNRNKYETEAEAISYVVSKYLGLQTTDYSLSYLYSWSKEKDFKEIDDSLKTIVNYSKNIINNFEKIYNKDFAKEITVCV